MARIILNGQIVDDSWQFVAKDSTALPSGSHYILHVDLWQQALSSGKTGSEYGVWFDSDDLPQGTIVSSLHHAPVIGIHFPVFTDGRGFSIARLLRERYGYRGDIRAFGYVLRDQLCFMKRCGFTSFVLQEHVDLDVALASLEDFTEYYQTSVDQPQPLFRRA